MFYKFNIPSRKCCCYSLIEQEGFFPELEFCSGDSIESIERYSKEKLKNSEAKITFKFFFWNKL